MPPLKRMYNMDPSFEFFEVIPKAAKVPQVTVHILAVLVTFLHF